jgi:putative ABC transport system permease protein
VNRADLPRLLGFLLRVQPRWFRERYGDAQREMLILRTADARRRGPWSYMRFLLREGGGLLRCALRERRVAGGVQQSEARPAGRGMMLHELRMAFRRLTRAPGFSVAAIAMLGLGLGASAAVFTLLNAVVLRPLPYPESDRLVWLEHGAPGFGLDHGVGITTWLYVHYDQSSRLLDGIAIAQRNGGTLTEADGPAELLRTAAATAGSAAVLGVPPALGRWFREDDRNTVVLSWNLWQRRFGGDPGVIGRTLRMDGVDREVVGVMPQRFAFPDENTAIWTPVEYTATHQDGGFNYVAVGRTTAGVTMAGLRDELQSLIERAPEAFGNQPHVARRVREGRIQATPITLHEHVVGDLRATLWMLMGAVLLVLLTAWANVANLFVVRSDTRRREVAVRRALGAGRGEIGRFFLAEGLLIALAGGAVGTLLAAAAVRVITALPNVDLPRADAIAFDAGGLLLALVLSLVAGLGLATIPLVQGGAYAAGVLREESRSSTAGRARLRFRAVLMAGQVALAMMLIAAAGLLLRSHANARSANPGFAARDVLFFDIALPFQSYPERDAATVFYQRVLDRVSGLPSVEGAAMATCVPMDGYCWGESMLAEHSDPVAADGGPVVSLRRVSPGYFGALDLPVLAGRTFLPDDARDDVVVLGREAARRLFPDGEAVGRRVTPGSGDAEGQWFTVVGVVADVATRSVMEASPEPAVYLPIRDTRDATVTLHRMIYIVRTAGNPGGLVPAVRAAVRELDAEVAVARARTLRDVLAADRAIISFGTMLLVIAGGVALVLGALGIYAVFSYVVGRRTTEIGVRLALGASAADVAGLVLRQAAIVTAVGAVVGLMGAAALTRTLSSLLFGVRPLDALVFMVSTVLLLVVALAAAAIPARRAWRLRPVEALRSG